MQYMAPKDPQETADYAIDWAELLDDSETISTSSWAVSPTGPTLSGAGTSGTRAYVFVAGGTAGTEYVLTNTIITSGGRTYEKSLVVPVLQD